VESKNRTATRTKARSQAANSSAQPTETTQESVTGNDSSIVSVLLTPSGGWGLDLRRVDGARDEDTEARTRRKRRSRDQIADVHGGRNTARSSRCSSYTKGNLFSVGFRYCVRPERSDCPDFCEANAVRCSPAKPVVCFKGVIDGFPGRSRA
jgi:hypothetical protein